MLTFNDAEEKAIEKAIAVLADYDTIGIDTAAAIPLISFSGIGNKAAPTPGIKRRCRHIPHPFGIRRTLLSCRQSGAGIHKSTNL